MAVIPYLTVILLGVFGHFSQSPNPKIRFPSTIAFIVLVVGMFFHLVPGFNNPLVIDGVQFAEDSIPFRMYLNYDKWLAGVFLFWFFVWPNQKAKFDKAVFVVIAKTLGVLVVTMMGLALAISYVRFDLKFPSSSVLWMVNNLFLVCFAEECLFRGFIQRQLIDRLPKSNVGLITGIVSAAVLFGLAHFKGGVIYVVLASVAGLFYGYAYSKTSRIEAPILVHFGLNAVHFFFFSYPALV